MVGDYGNGVHTTPTPAALPNATSFDRLSPTMTSSITTHTSLTTDWLVALALTLHQHLHHENALLLTFID